MKHLATLLFPLLLLVGVAVSSFAQDTPPDLDKLTTTALHQVQNLDMDAAEKSCDEIISRFNGHPFGYFGRAVVAWARLEYAHEQSDPEMEKEFEKRTEDAIVKGEAYLEKYPRDANGQLAMGGMLGMRSRLALMKHSYMRAYFSGKKAISHMNKAIEIDPKLYDAYIGPGMYEYYAGTLPAVVRVLARLFMHGDPDKGISMLKLSMEKGHYMDTVSKLVLIEIYTQDGSRYANPKQALEWAKQLRVQFPNQPLIQFVEIVCLHQTGDYEGVGREAEEYLKRIHEERPYYLTVYIPRAYLAWGTSYLSQHKWAEALDKFSAAARTLDGGQKPNRWAVWALVRIGNVYDLMGNRELALLNYRKALKVKDQWGFRDFISKYISKPYTLQEVPGQLPPP